MTKQKRRPGPESTLDEVRAQLIAAGTKLLEERGVDVGLAHITLSDAIAEAGVTRSTAYRSLADDDLAPQAVLHRALLTSLLTRNSRAVSIDAIGVAVSKELENQTANMASDDIADRTRALRAIIRVGAAESYNGVAASRERSTLTAIYGALRSLDEEDDWRYQALVKGEIGLTEVFTTMYEGLAELFGYRIKSIYTLEQFTGIAASLIEGIALRHGINPHIGPMYRPTGEGGELESWTAFATAFEALFIGFFELDNPDEPFADLTRY